MRLRGLRAGLMQAEVPHGPHRLVALTRLEAFVRFGRVLQQEPAAIPRVLSVFLGPLGIGHPARVRKLPSGSRPHSLTKPCAAQHQVVDL